jgi:hypothetical protein
LSGAVPELFVFGEPDDGGQWGAASAELSQQLWLDCDPGLLVYPGSAEFYGDDHDAQAARPDEFEPAASRRAGGLFEPDTVIDDDRDRSNRLKLSEFLYYRSDRRQAR